LVFGQSLYPKIGHKFIQSWADFVNQVFGIGFGCPIHFNLNNLNFGLKITKNIVKVGACVFDFAATESLKGPFVFLDLKIVFKKSLGQNAEFKEPNSNFSQEPNREG
jgi:hypothetical protein